MYTHASDPGYTCVGCTELVAAPPCHAVGNFLVDQGYDRLDWWNRIAWWMRVAPESVTEHCGNPK